jgi:taurine--2-oxoglutarate transaminase
LSGLHRRAHLEEILHEGAHTVAGDLEPVVGTNGIIVPPDGYPGDREVCDRHGILLSPTR